MLRAIYQITLPGYSHHRVFDEVAQGLQGGFAELGFRVPIVNEPMENSLVLGANIAPQFVPHVATIFNLEAHSSGWWTPNYLKILRTHPTWDYSQANLDHLRMVDIAGSCCPIGYHECLSRIKPAAVQDIDVLFYGSIFGRRIPILKAIEDTGLNTKWLFNVYGKERDDYISRAKVVLNIHAYECAPPETPRLSYLYANECCVVSEHETSVALIPDVLKTLVEDTIQRRSKAKADALMFKKQRQAEFLKALI